MKQLNKKRIGILIIFFELLGGFLIGWGVRPMFISETHIETQTGTIIYFDSEQKDLFESKLIEELINVNYNVTLDRIIINETIVILGGKFFDYYEINCIFYDYIEFGDEIVLWFFLHRINPSNFVINEILFEEFSIIFSNGYKENDGLLLKGFFLDNGKLELEFIFFEFHYKSVFDERIYYDVSGMLDLIDGGCN